MMRNSENHNRSIALKTNKVLWPYRPYLRIKISFFNLHDVMKTVVGAKIPRSAFPSCRILATSHHVG